MDSIDESGWTRTFVEPIEQGMLYEFTNELHDVRMFTIRKTPGSHNLEIKVSLGGPGVIVHGYITDNSNVKDTIRRVVEKYLEERGTHH